MSPKDQSGICPSTLHVTRGSISGSKKAYIGDLKVPMREIHYDDKGLKVGTPGPFVESDIQIEGFFPRPGVRSVLRVNRYPLKTPASNGSNYAYVLDMVVEVEAVQSAEPAAGKPAEDKAAAPAKTP